MGYFANGAEGAQFEEQWCSRCTHSDHRHGKQIGDTDNPPCPVWIAHLLYGYQECSTGSVAETILGLLIPRGTITASDGHPLPTNECAMFHPRDAGAAIPGQQTLDMDAG